MVPCDPETLETSQDPESNQGICRIGLTDGDRELIVDTGGPVRHPSPSPDGGQHRVCLRRRSRKWSEGHPASRW